MGNPSKIAIKNPSAVPSNSLSTNVTPTGLQIEDSWSSPRLGPSHPLVPAQTEPAVDSASAVKWIFLTLWTYINRRQKQDRSFSTFLNNFLLYFKNNLWVNSDDVCLHSIENHYRTERGTRYCGIYRRLCSRASKLFCLFSFFSWGGAVHLRESSLPQFPSLLLDNFLVTNLASLIKSLCKF